MGQKSVAQQPIVELRNGIDEAKKLFQQTFVAQWCPYCKDLKKTLTYHLKQKLPRLLVDIDEPKNQDLVNMFKIVQVPAVYLFEGSLHDVLFKFMGNDAEQSRKMLQVFMQALYKPNKPDVVSYRPPEKVRLQESKNSCQAGHPLELVTSLEPPYINNEYACDLCRKVGMASPFHKIKHCKICNFDVCPECFPPSDRKPPQNIILFD